MAPVKPEFVVAVAIGAGFQGEALRKAVAVSFAENEPHDPALLGDVDLKNATWGPSVGLWQIRSLKAEYGKGTTRDEKALDNPEFNAHSAFKISGGGKNWQPWTMYTNGRYRSKLAAADAAIKANGGKVGGVAGDPDIPTENVTDDGGLAGISGRIAQSVNAAMESFFKAGINVGAVVLALVLFVLGVAILMRGPIQRNTRQIAKLAANAAPQGKAASAVGKVATS